MNSKQSAIESIVDVKMHESELACHFKHHDCREVANVCTKLAVDSNRSLHLPIHELLRVIELSCVHQRGKSKPFTRKELAKSVNILKDFDDPNLLHILGIDDGLYYFFNVLSRQQIEPQQEFNTARFFFCRSCYMLTHTDLARFWQHISNSYGINYHQWIGFFIIIWATTQDKKVPIHIRDILNFSPIRNTPSLNAILQHFSLTPSEIRDRYYYTRKHTVSNPLLWSTIRSIFWERPFIRFDNDSIIPPLPPVLGRHSLYSLNRLLPDELQDDFGNTLATIHENYVYELLVHQYGKDNVYNLHPLTAELSGVQLPDFLVITDSYRVYIEVKATLENRPLLTQSEVGRTTLDKSIHKAFSQLASAIGNESNISELLNIDIIDQPILGIIAVPDDQFMANTEWRWSRINLPYCQKNGIDKLIASYAIRPQVMSLQTMEALCNHAEGDSELIYELFSKQNTNNMAVNAPDWPTMLGNLDSNCWKPLSIFRDKFSEIAEQIGSSAAQ